MSTEHTGHGAASSNKRSIARVCTRVRAIARSQSWAVVVALAIVGCDGAASMNAVDAGLAPTDAPLVTHDAAAHDAAAHDAATHDGARIDAASASCDCFDGPGTYCEVDVAARAASDHCVIAGASAHGDRLFSCDAHGWRATASCGSGCEQGESGASAACSLPICDCFVRSSWCGASAARHGLTLTPPCRVPLVPAHDSDILGCDAQGHWIVLQACPRGCQENPTGTPDSCVAAQTPTDPGWAACAHHGPIASGMDPEASDRLRCAGVTADRVTQTIGYATASAGYHAPDGTVDGHPYTAAVDLSVRGMTHADVRALLDRLGQNGFAAWYREPGYDGWPAGEAEHIHAVFAGVIMKAELRGQIRDYLAGLNGLVSHTHYAFWSAPSGDRTIVRLLFERHYSP